MKCEMNYLSIPIRLYRWRLTMQIYTPHLTSHVIIIQAGI